MKPRRRPRRQTGVTGTVGLSSAGSTPAFDRVVFPADKEGAEEFIVRAFASTLAAEGEDFYELLGPPERNGEDNLDFTLRTRSGNQYLELVEFAPLEPVGGRYEALPGKYVAGAMADALYACIDKKLKKYGSHTAPLVHLLVYTTDWRLALHPWVAGLVSFRCTMANIPFASVAHFTPSDEACGTLLPLHPAPPGVFAGYCESRVRSRVFYLSDITRPERSVDGRGVTFKPAVRNAQEPYR